MLSLPSASGNRSSVNSSPAHQRQRSSWHTIAYRPDSSARLNPRFVTNDGGCGNYVTPHRTASVRPFPSPADLLSPMAHKKSGSRMRYTAPHAAALWRTLGSRLWDSISTTWIVVVAECASMFAGRPRQRAQLVGLRPWPGFASCQKKSAVWRGYTRPPIPTERILVYSFTGLNTSTTAPSPA